MGLPLPGDRIEIQGADGTWLPATVEGFRVSVRGFGASSAGLLLVEWDEVGGRQWIDTTQHFVRWPESAADPDAIEVDSREVRRPRALPPGG